MNPQLQPYQDGSTDGSINRANEVRRDDLVKVPSIGIYDIDFAVYSHLVNQIKPTVVENGDNSIEVPVQFANGETWSQIRQYGFIRDGTNKVMAPIIILRRSSIATDDRFPIQDTRNPFVGKFTVVPYKTNSMQWDRIAGQYQVKESIESYVVDIPKNLRFSYELVIFTDLVEQMNVIIQAILGATNQMWGDYFKFRTVIQDTTHDNVNLPGEDRLVKTTMTLQVDGHIRNEYEYHESKIQKQFSVKRVVFMNETTDEIFPENLDDDNSRQHGEISNEQINSPRQIRL